MKKYVSLILSFVLILTMALPINITATQHSDLFEYLYEKQVNPYMFSGTIQSFISYEDIGNTYKLRNSEEIEMVCDEISTFLRSYDISEEELMPYVEDFFAYFADKEELFNVLVAFVINTENVILPFTKQPVFEENVVGAKDTIKEKFYSVTVFLNYLSYISEAYYENKTEMAIKLIDERLIFNSDVTDSIDFLETADRSVASSAISILTETIDTINDGDVIERIDFADYLVLLGFVSLEMDDTIKDDDPTTTVNYQKLYPEYGKGFGSVNEFYNIEEITAEYLPRIESESTQFDKNKIVEQAMTKATTIRIKSSEVINSKKVEYNISNEKLIEFAALCGKKLRSELVKKGVSVSKNQSYTLVIEFDNSEKANGMSLTMPTESLDMLEENNVTAVKINSSCGSFVLNTTTFKERELVSGGSLKFEIEKGKASDIIPGLELYAQGSDVTRIGLYGDDECVEDIPYGALHFEMNVSGKESEYGENNIYSIASDGERTKVLRYNIVDGVVSFEIGEGRCFAKIDGELTKPNPESTKPETENKPSNSTGNNGNVWVDDSDDDVNTDNNNTDDTDKENNTNKEENNDDKDQSSETKPQPKPEINFSDVADNHWAKDYIKNLAEKGILSGVGNNLFAPDNNVTREQFAKIVVMAFDILDENAECDFADVDKDAWYGVYVASAYKKGIINGIGNGLFGTGQNITRQDMATMIVRAANACSVTIGEKANYSFNDDAYIADYAQDAVKILVGSGAVSGFEDNSFRPLNHSTRAQVAKIISSILSYKE